MNKTLLACTIAAFSMSAPVMAGSDASHASSSNNASNSQYSGYYYIVGTQVKRANQDPSASFSALTEAAQRVRDAIQQIAEHPAGEGRNAAIRSAHRALYDTQQAMIDLPPELRRSSGSDDAMSKQDYDRSLEKLKEAAQTLRESVQAMAQQPAREGRNEAAEQVTDAILELNQAMVQLPWEPYWMKDQKQNQAQDASAQTRSGSSTMASFDRIDTNNDGMLSRQEYRKHITQQSESDRSTSQRGQQAAYQTDRQGWFERGQPLKQPNDPHTFPSDDNRSSQGQSASSQSDRGSDSSQPADQSAAQRQAASSAYQAAR